MEIQRLLVTLLIYLNNPFPFLGEWTNGPNILGLIMFAIVLGVSLAKLGEKGKPLLDFFTSLSDAMMTITTWVINLAPVGVFFLIGGQVLGTQDFGKVLEQLGWYFSTVIIGGTKHVVVVTINDYFTLIRSLHPRLFGFARPLHSGHQEPPLQVPGQHDLGLHHRLWDRVELRHPPCDHRAAGEQEQGGPQGVQVSMASVLFREDNVSCVRFILPIGATINMDGTALYEAIAAIFIAQVNNMNPTIGQLFAISITATAASIGAAGIPQVK